MSFGIGSMNSNSRTYTFYNKDGSVAGTLGVTKATSSAQKKLKKLQYNFKLISSQILRAKTSGTAVRAVSSAKRKTAELRRKLKTGEYDDTELAAAIIHAEAMERIAKKRVKHLQEEERAERSQQPCEAELEEKMDTACEEDVSETAEEISEELSEELSKEMEQMLKEYEEQMNEMMEEGWQDELSDSFLSGGVDMDPADIKALKQKHRSKELQEIAKADAKYLKAIFQKYAADKQQAMSGGVSLNLGGMEQPMAVPAATPPPASAEGAAVDVSV